MLKNGISIIICCYNSSTRIQQTLCHLALQELKGTACEIILVDNASTDDTMNVAKDFWQTLRNNEIIFTTIHEPKPGLANARQTAINNCNYDCFIFCDDDNWLDKEYIFNTWQILKQHPNVALVGGLGTAAFEEHIFIPQWFNKFSACYALGIPQEKQGIVNSIHGAGASGRTAIVKSILNKSPFLLHGRRNIQLTSGEDSELCYKLRLAGYDIYYSSKLTFRHLIPANRLSWTYLQKLNIGLAETFVILNLYERALNSNKKHLSAFYWLKQLFYFTAIYIKYWFPYYKIYKNTEGTVEEIRHMVWKNIAFSYLKHNFKTVRLYKTILRLKK